MYIFKKKFQKKIKFPKSFQKKKKGEEEEEKISNEKVFGLGPLGL